MSRVDDHTDVAAVWSLRVKVWFVFAPNVHGTQLGEATERVACCIKQVIGRSLVLDCHVAGLRLLHRWVIGNHPVKYVV